MMIQKSPEQVPDKPQKQWLLWVSGLAIVGVIIVLGVWITSIPSFPEWTQFEEKGLWDLLELIAALAVPIVLALFGVWFTRTENERQHEIAEKSRAQERGLALDDQQERALQEYLDRMSELLLDKGLRESETRSKEREVAFARTHTVLRRLDPLRRTSVLKFLLSLRLVGGSKPIIGLYGADLRGVELRLHELDGTDLAECNLQGTVFAFTGLVGSNLSGANFDGANLHYARLQNTHLTGTSFVGANLEQARFDGARIGGGYMGGKKFNMTNFAYANLRGADLSGVSNLAEANLTGADLTNAILPEGFVLPAAKPIEPSQDKALQ